MLEQLALLGIITIAIIKVIYFIIFVYTTFKKPNVENYAIPTRTKKRRK